MLLGSIDKETGSITVAFGACHAQANMFRCYGPTFRFSQETGVVYWWDAVDGKTQQAVTDYLFRKFGYQVHGHRLILNEEDCAKAHAEGVFRA